jgi:PAS domain S-box-containing protein
MRSLATSRRVEAYRQLVRSYRRLIRLLDRVVSRPESVDALPVDELRPGSVERRLLTGLQSMVKRLEAGREELRASEQRFELAMRGANDGLWDWNPVTNEVYYSPRWKEMLGYADDEVPNRFDEWLSRVHPDDRERARAAIDAYLSGETPTYRLEHRLRHRDGSYRWIVTRGASVRDETGRIVRIAGSHADITERRRAEEALREREHQYRGIFESVSDGIAINDLESGRLVEANPAFLRMHGYTREELIGAYPPVFIHPDSHHLFKQFTETIAAGGEFFGQAVDVHKDGSLIHVEVRGSPITYMGRPSTLGVVRDITERVQAYQLLEQRVEERTRELSTLLDVSNSVASTLELQPLVGLILDQLKMVADYSGASLLTLEDDALVVLDARGASAAGGVTVGLRFPIMPGTPIVEMLERREAVIVDDVQGPSALARAYQGAVGPLNETDAFSFARSWMAVPMVLNDRVTGILSLSHSQADFYTPQHARLARAIANQAAVAIENARLYAQAQAAAVLEERQRLARELHDSVTQSLFSMTMISGALPKLMERDIERARERSERLHELSQGALAEMRALIFELHPESLEREGLIVALDKQVAAVRARHGLRVETDWPPRIEAPIEVQEAAFRIAQEAMHNTVKHARASVLHITLHPDGGVLALTVRDDGAGFDPSGDFPGHLGHRSMRERIARLGGTLAIESAPGQGTCIRATLPLDRRRT